jgi:hypothetical protein
MIVLNKNILKLILTNIGTNIVSSFINLSRCTEILKVIVKILNKSEFDIEPIWNDEGRHKHVLINVEKEPYTKSFNLKLPKSLSKRISSSTIKHLSKESFLLITDNIELYKLNSKTKECTALIKEKLSSYKLNRENSTISTFINDKKANVMVLKVINFEGLVLHNIPKFQTSFNTGIYNDNIFYYLQNGNQLKGFNLKSTEHFNIYTGKAKSEIAKLYTTNNYLLAIITKGILIHRNDTKDNTSVVKFEITPRKMYSLSNDTFLVLGEDNLFYEFDILTQNFKRIYFEFDEKLKIDEKPEFDDNSESDEISELGSVQVYSDKESTKIIILINEIYYLINKQTKHCFYKGQCTLDPVYMDIVNNKILDFQFSHNYTLFEEYSLISYRKIISLNKLLPNFTDFYESYKVPSSRNLITVYENDVYYYTYNKNTIKFITEIPAGDEQIQPSSAFTFILTKNNSIYVYDCLNAKHKVLTFKCLHRTIVLDNYIAVVHDDYLMSIYDSRFNKLLSCEKFIKFEDLYVDFKRLILVVTETSYIMFIIKNCKPVKIYEEKADNVINYCFENKSLFYLETKDGKKVVIDEENRVKTLTL